MNSDESGGGGGLESMSSIIHHLGWEIIHQELDSLFDFTQTPLHSDCRIVHIVEDKIVGG